MIFFKENLISCVGNGKRSQYRIQNASNFYRLNKKNNIAVVTGH